MMALFLDDRCCVLGSLPMTESESNGRIDGDAALSTANQLGAQGFVLVALSRSIAARERLNEVSRLAAVMREYDCHLLDYVSHSGSTIRSSVRAGSSTPASTGIPWNSWPKED